MSYFSRKLSASESRRDRSLSSSSGSFLHDFRRLRIDSRSSGSSTERAIRARADTAAALTGDFSRITRL